jgi:hypothetical protein
VYVKIGGLAIWSKESENWLTPEEWKKKMERKRKKTESDSSHRIRYL